MPESGPEPQDPPCLILDVAVLIVNGLEEQRQVRVVGAELKKVGMEAPQNIQGKFDELGQAVDAKQEDLVNELASKYVESRDAVDTRIKEMKEANTGVVDKARDAVMGVPGANRRR